MAPPSSNLDMEKGLVALSVNCEGKLVWRLYTGLQRAVTVGRQNWVNPVSVP